MKKVTNTLITLAVSFILLLCVLYIYGYFDNEKQAASLNSIESFDYMPSTSGRMLYHENYCFSYSEEHEQSKWVAYKLTSANFNDDIERSGSFRKDGLVETETAVTGDYTGSGYDRGHLAPAADMRHNQISMYESFYMSNISPQKPKFNRGIWKKLENKTREWALESDGVYVVTGPVLTEFIDTIGVRNRIPVPKYFYKVMMDVNHTKMLAFILPNEYSNTELSEYVVTVDSLESLTGIDFYPALPYRLENKLERSKVVEINDWSFE